jgi:hypothetical protein
MWCKCALLRSAVTAPVFDFIALLIDMNAALQSSVKTVTTKWSLATDSLKVLSSDYTKYKAEQDQFSTTLIAKTCLLLNAKKVEIKRLQGEFFF